MSGSYLLSSTVNSLTRSFKKSVSLLISHACPPFYALCWLYYLLVHWIVCYYLPTVCGMPFFQFITGVVMVYSVVDELVAMEAKIFFSFLAMTYSQLRTIMKFNITQVSTTQTRYWLNLNRHRLYIAGTDIPVYQESISPAYMSPSSANLLCRSFREGISVDGGASDFLLVFWSLKQDSVILASW